ncbi:MAG: cytochrome P450 [Caulobacteraceae bacterium]|nr:cytochrome P450 [Caulobacteraceae bacterium]
MEQKNPGAVSSPACPFSAETQEKILHHFDHHSSLYRDHSAEALKLLRDQAPVAKTDAHGGFYVLTRYQDVLEAARDDERFCSFWGITIPTNKAPWDRAQTIPIDLDPPYNELFRDMMLPLFTPKAIDAYGVFLRQTATKLVDAFIEKGEADLARDFGSPLTALFTMELAGIDHAQADFYASTIQYGIAHPGDPDALARMAEARGRVSREVAAQKDNPRSGGLIDYLFKARVGGRPLMDWEIEAIVWLVLLGGVDSTQATISNMAVHLSDHPELKQRLIEHPDSWDDAVEEYLRLVTPQQGLSRTVTRETSLGGVELQRGDRVLMSWQAANLDESVFPNPNEIVLDRKNKRHLAFGIGKHRCMGSNIGRLEVLIALEQLLTRIPDFKVKAGEAELSADIGTVKAYKKVPITFTPGKRSA